MNFLYKVTTIFCFLQLSNLALIIPLKNININVTNEEIKSNYLSKLYSNHLYIDLIIGSKKEEIKGILNMSQIGFYIYDNAYNYNNSFSFMKENKSRTFYKRNNEEGFISSDIICLNNIDTFKKNIIEKCKKSQNISFALLKCRQKNIDENINEKYSIIGLQLNDYNDEYIFPLFIHSLKKANIMDSYLFSFIFNKNEINNEEIGYLLLGNNTQNNENIEIKTFSAKRKYGHPFWGIYFDQINVGLNNSLEASKENNFKSLYYKDVELDASLPYIVGIYEYNIHMKFYFFYNLLSNNICKYITVPLNPDYSTFVCDSKNELFIEAYNTKFPKLFFVHIESNTTFILDKEDLFTYNLNNKSDTQIYFLVFFYNHQGKYDEITKFKLGIPFFKKYKFSFDSDNRVMHYYENTTNKKRLDRSINDKENDKKIFKLFIIFFLLIIFFILGILFHKNIIKLPRKKIANELEDDFEYKAKPIMSDNNYDINKENTSKNSQNIEFKIKNII